MAKNSTDCHFKAVIADGTSFKFFIDALKCLEFTLLRLTITRHGIFVNQSNSAVQRPVSKDTKIKEDIFVSWSLRSEDLIIYEYNHNRNDSDNSEFDILVPIEELSTRISSVLKKHSIMLHKDSNDQVLKISIADTITKPNLDYFGASASLPLVTQHPPVGPGGETSEDENELFIEYLMPKY